MISSLLLTLSFVCFLFMNVCVYVSLCDFVCWGLLLPFVLGFCLFFFVLVFFGFLLSCFFIFASLFVLSFFFLWVCVCLFVRFFLLVLLLPSGLRFYLFVFWLLVFFLPNRVAGGVLVLQPEPPRWESWTQDIGPQEITQPHVISINESSPEALCLNTKTQLHPIASKLQCWTSHAKQLARQEHNPTH